MAGERIVVVAYHFSVVMKSIENKLTKMGFSVDTIEKPNETPLYYDGVSLFILHLSADLFTDKLKLQRLEDACQQINKAGKNILAIGEKKFEEDAMAAVPLLQEYMWINRPIDMDTFPDTVKRAVNQGNLMAEHKHILIVDDDPSYAKMVREWLKNFYDVDIVTAGMQAITFLLKHQVDLILLDYEMPIVDGPQVLQMLRSEPEVADIPVIFLTGVSTREEVAKVMALKPAGYILKSTTREKLLKYLSELNDEGAKSKE
ncbi:MAG: response regulator [Pseudobutyrivibrio sp.]|nr:response regulator [Pseudobutyrivibrio sp.]